MTRLIKYVADAIRRPREQLTRGQHFVRFSRDLAVHCYRQLERHRAEGMAAELTYRTIFALIPVVVLGLVMFRVFGGLDEVQSKVEDQLYSFFGVPEIPDDYLESPLDESAAASDPSESGVQSAPSSSAETGSFVPADRVSATVGGEDLPSAETETSAEGEAPPDNAIGRGGDEDAATADDEPATLPAAEGLAVGVESPQTNSDPDPDDSDAVTEVTDSGVEPQQDSDAETSRAAAEAEMQTRRQTRANIRRTLSEVTSKVTSIDFASIGVFGLLLFIYAAVALADSTEYLFNRIYEAPSQRPIHIRIAIHWSIITLGSGLLAMSLYMSGQVIEWFGQIGAGATIRGILSHAVAASASWVLLFLLYALMPNTHVSVKAAAASALVAALLWEAAKFGFQIYVVKAVPYSAIYGSIGLIPLFLFWIYVTWLIVLFGLILTYTLQTLRGSRVVRTDVDTTEVLSGDPDWMLPIMTEVARAFTDGEVIDNQELADRLGLTSRVTLGMVSELIGVGLLRRVTAGAGEEESLTLAKPAEAITVGEILQLAHHTRPTSNHPSWQMLSDLKQAERSAADGVSLHDVLQQSDAVRNKAPSQDADR